MLAPCANRPAFASHPAPRSAMASLLLAIIKVLPEIYAPFCTKSYSTNTHVMNNQVCKSLRSNLWLFFSFSKTIFKSPLGTSSRISRNAGDLSKPGLLLIICKKNGKFEEIRLTGMRESSE